MSSENAPISLPRTTSDVEKRLLDECMRQHQRIEFPEKSQFRVVAALMSASGHIYSGTNFEGNDIRDTLCAERTALANAWMDGCTGPFTHVAVIGEHAVHKNIPATTPCLLCRQVLFEMAELWQTPMQVIYAKADGSDIHSVSLETLAPEAFGPSSMGIEDLHNHATLPAELVKTSPKLGDVMDESSAWQLDLIAAAKQAAEFSYAPYIGDKQGTAVAYRDPSQEDSPLYLSLGCLMENAAYGCSTPASLMARALARFHLGKQPEFVCENLFPDA